jgi:hypothetical protein
MQMNFQIHFPVATGTHLIGGWVGPRSGLEAVEKGKIHLTRLIPITIILDFLMQSVGLEICFHNCHYTIKLGSSVDGIPVLLARSFERFYCLVF